MLGRGICTNTGVCDECMEAVRMMAENSWCYDIMMESSRKLESSLHISFCYGELQRMFSNYVCSVSECYGKSRDSCGEQEIVLGFTMFML